MALSLMSNGGGGGLSGKLKVFNRTGGEGGVIKYPPAPLYAYVTRFQTHTNFFIERHLLS